jgi:hypothetical protein
VLLAGCGGGGSPTVDPQSDAFIDFIGRSRASHPDFGPPPYGIPYSSVGGSQPRVPVTFVDYGSESVPGWAVRPAIRFPTRPGRNPTSSKAACPAAARTATATC